MLGRLTAAIVVALLLATSAQAAAPVQPYRTNDLGGFHDVLPPGTNGLANAPGLAAFEATGKRPAHSDDQLAMYRDLMYDAPGLDDAGLGRHYKDSSFGFPPGDDERTYSPGGRDDVTVVRDRSFGVPHVYGTTRAGAMFALGYVTAEDRLFFIDVLRHLGRAQLTPFAGGAPGNRAFDESQWQIAPYTEEDMERQIDLGLQRFGAEGQQVNDDSNNYVAGINAYISEAKLDPTKMPGEYAAINQPLGPEPWKATDLIAEASLVGGIFGRGGGKEIQSMKLLARFQARFGVAPGARLWRQFAAVDDPEAPTTVRGHRFGYQTTPRRVTRGSAAVNKGGPLVDAKVVESGADAGASAAAATRATSRARGLLAFPHANSNALVVSAAKSASGHPLAVFGPQVAYFAPEILMEQDVHAPGIDARGAAFPGVNLYVELGRGRDYAWSATSAGQDITDTFAVELCEPDGSAPTLQSMSYRFRDQCLPIESLRRTNSWSPSVADSTPAGTQTLRTDRTKLGLVVARGTVAGKPVAYTQLRSTYMHEIDSARGFIDFNDPSKMRTPSAFKRAANKIGYTFNWLYVNKSRDAYFNSGAMPVRGRNTSTNFPIWGGSRKFEWQGWDPVRRTSKLIPFGQHANTVDQRFLTSWNNKQAPGYRTSDSKWSYSPVFRSQSLDDRIRAGIRGARKMSLVGLVDAMEDAGTVDLRGTRNLPLALKILGRQSNPKLAAAIAKLRAWVRAGAHRRDKDRNHRYEHAEAIRIMDAWFPRWVAAEFKPTIGGHIFDRIDAINEVDNAPNNHGDHLGSAYDDGWYGYINKDLRQVLHKRVRGRYSRTYCGRGKRKACRALLARSLATALTIPQKQVYSGDAECEDGDQWCWDAVRHRPLGAITQPLIHWINRPTFQQTVEIRRSAP